LKPATNGQPVYCTGAHSWSQPSCCSEMNFAISAVVLRIIAKLCTTLSLTENFHRKRGTVGRRQQSRITLFPGSMRTTRQGYLWVSCREYTCQRRDCLISVGTQRPTSKLNVPWPKTVTWYPETAKLRFALTSSARNLLCISARSFRHRFASARRDAARNARSALAFRLVAIQSFRLSGVKFTRLNLR
jgi:hypothetical protein